MRIPNAELTRCQCKSHVSTTVNRFAPTVGHCITPREECGQVLNERKRCNATNCGGVDQSISRLTGAFPGMSHQVASDVGSRQSRIIAQFWGKPLSLRPMSGSELAVLLHPKLSQLQFSSSAPARQPGKSSSSFVRSRFGTLTREPPITGRSNSFWPGSSALGISSLKTSSPSQRANDLACFGLAQARRTTLSLRPASADAEPCVR